MYKIQKCILAVLVICSGSFFLWMFNDSVLYTFDSSPLRSSKSDYVVDMNAENGEKEKLACDFPEFDPFHKDAMKYYEQYDTVHCHGMTTLTYYDGEAVRVNQTLKSLHHGSKAVECWYRTATYQRDAMYVHSEWRGPFTDYILVKTKPEFVEARCSKSRQTVSQMHHYATRDELRKGKKPMEARYKTSEMNVILVGVDSLANYLFKRAMPKTRQFLVEQMGAIELNKYNKVGDNTFPNMLAILTGLYENEPRDWTQAQGFDNLPFIWNDYKKKGYRTQYASDRFDFNDFIKPPTDNYNLPMMSALMKDKIDFDNDCFEDKNEVKLWLDYIIEFAKESVFSGNRFFSIAMIKRPTHDFPNKAGAVDERYADFLKELDNNGLLNNTFLAFFGDHGPRLNMYRRTFLGSIEERAANMVIYVPPRFRKQYKQHYNNLKTNAERLTTNFDLYATIKSLLSLYQESYMRDDEKENSPQALPRGMSLFSKIPPTRNCKDAQLDAHNCLCNGGVSVVDAKLMKEIGESVVDHINTLLTPVSSKCAPLTLKKVNFLTILTGTLRWSATYRVMLSTDPGGAEFEATVEYTVTAVFFTSVRTLSYISRLNMYKGQSDCVDYDKSLRMYCYCRNLLTKDGSD